MSDEERLKAESGRLKVGSANRTGSTASPPTLQPSDFSLQTSPKVLIAGIGNIFLGDDAFGVEVLRRLAGRELPRGVTAVDFGIRGLDLTYALLDESYDNVILVDAVTRGGVPGTLYVIEPDPDAVEQARRQSLDADAGPALDTHNMDPDKVMRLVIALGGDLRRVVMVGCEPSPKASYEEMSDGLTAPARAAVGEAVRMIESLTAEMLRRTPQAAR